jgi:hypothetical protein
MSFKRRHSLFLILCLLLMGCLAACRQSQQATPTDDAGVTLELQVSPQPPTVDDSVLLITLLDARGTPINDATIEIRGDMTHAGMQPVTATAKGGVEGQYQIPFGWTMGGDWVLTVNATLTDGTVVTKTFPFTVNSQ